MDIYFLKQLPNNNPPYDETLGVVVLASSPLRARKLAGTEAGDEGADFWLDPKKASCKKVSLKSASHVIYAR